MTHTAAELFFAAAINEKMKLFTNIFGDISYIWQRR